MSKTPRQQLGREPKNGSVGMLKFKINEMKNKTMSFVAIDVDGLTYLTTKKKNSSHLKVDETLYFPISNPRANVHVFVYRQRLVGSKCVGFHQFNLSDLKETSAEDHWIQTIAKPKNFVEPDIGEVKQVEPAEGAGDKKKKKSSKKEKKYPQMNCQIQFVPLEKKEVKLEGIVLDGEWKEGFASGNIIANPKWYENPQFQLTVSGKMPVTLGLHQSDTSLRVTLFILKYDSAFYGGMPLTIYNPDEVYKIDENFLNTMAADHIEQTFDLEAGSYIVIPCNLLQVNANNPEPYFAKFKIYASCPHMDALEFQPIDWSKLWHAERFEKHWDSKTCGGSDLGNVLDFYENYQFVLDVKEEGRFSVTMEQPTNANKIGFYIFAAEQTEHKEINLTHPVQSTDHMISNVFIGKNIKLDKGKYILVPCMSEIGVEGDFILKVFGEKEFAMTELTQTWKKVISIDGEWKEGCAGGNVSDAESFVTNPQYAIRAKYNGEKNKDIIILLSQFIGESGKTESIALPIFVDLEQRLEADDVNEDNAVDLPEAWVNTKNVFSCFEVDEEDGFDVIVIPSTMKPNTFASFRVVVLTDVQDVVIEELVDE